MLILFPVCLSCFGVCFISGVLVLGFVILIFSGLAWCLGLYMSVSCRLDFGLILFVCRFELLVLIVWACFLFVQVLRLSALMTYGVLVIWNVLYFSGLCFWFVVVAWVGQKFLHFG